MWVNKLELYNPDTNKTFILAPRPRYSLEKISYKPNLTGTTSGNCATCGNDPFDNWDIVFTIHCIGNGDLNAARLVYTDLVKMIAEACADNKLRLSLQYCDETPLEHDVTKGYVQPVENDWEIDCCDNTTITVELHMTALDIKPDEPDITTYNYVVYAA